MSSDLADALGDEPPAAVAALPAEVLTRLAGQIEDARRRQAAVAALPAEVLTRLADQISDARRRQAAAMESGVKTALKGVPLPLRGVVRNALLG